MFASHSKFDMFLIFNVFKTIFISKKIKDSRENDREFRVVFINNEIPSGYIGETPLKYSGNEIKTSKVRIL